MPPISAVWTFDKASWDLFGNLNRGTTMMTLDELEAALRLDTEISVLWEGLKDAIGKEGRVRVRGPYGDEEVAKVLMMGVGEPWAYRFMGLAQLDGWDQELHRAPGKGSLNPRRAGAMLLHGIRWAREGANKAGPLDRVVEDGNEESLFKRGT